MQVKEDMMYHRVGELIDQLKGTYMLSQMSETELVEYAISFGEASALHKLLVLAGHDASEMPERTEFLNHVGQEIKDEIYLRDRR